MVPLLEHATLANCVRVSSAWHAAFAPIIDSLLGRLAMVIEELQCDDLLRRSTLFRERRRALRRSLEPETMIEVVDSLRGVGRAYTLSDAAREQMCVVMRVTTALAGTILAATDNPSALSNVPSALQADGMVGNTWVVKYKYAVLGIQHSGEMFAWEALEYADEHIECCLPWSRLVDSEAWRAIIEVASAQPWFVTNALSAAHAEESPEMNALARWSLAVMDEAGMMSSELEAKAADAELREIVRVRRTLMRTLKGREDTSRVENL